MSEMSIFYEDHPYRKEKITPNFAHPSTTLSQGHFIFLTSYRHHEEPFGTCYTPETGSTIAHCKMLCQTVCAKEEQNGVNSRVTRRLPSDEVRLTVGSYASIRGGNRRFRHSTYPSQFFLIPVVERHSNRTKSDINLLPKYENTISSAPTIVCDYRWLTSHASL
ncbi:unnamed protein product [Protopolystoma xenopodis]|uniref:Uncharacterized protein n=1 Tax=Protopolystoma xenopodis TaxID=117903 RepID=A0A3S5BWT1_9PLAT|nr:unnamed protein product [Protopolystoma xenopodis]